MFILSKEQIPEIYGENKEQFFTYKKCTTTIRTHQLLLLINDQRSNCVELEYLIR
jgi:hypothetical protein